MRTMADVGEPELRVRTGSTTSFQSQHDDAANVLVSVLLTPGPDYEKGFATNIGHTVAIIEPWVAPAHIAGLLRKLLRHRDIAVREQACLALSRTYPYRDPCLFELLKSTDSGIRLQAANMLAIQQKNETRLLRAFAEDPASLTISGKVEYLADELALFTLDRDPEVRALACDAIRRLFPLSAVSNCASEKEF
jgi:hypothetical protein